MTEEQDTTAGLEKSAAGLDIGAAEDEGYFGLRPAGSRPRSDYHAPRAEGTPKPVRTKRPKPAAAGKADPSKGAE